MEVLRGLNTEAVWHKDLEIEANGSRKDQRHMDVQITTNLYWQAWKDPEKCSKTHIKGGTQTYTHIHTHTH